MKDSEIKEILDKMSTTQLGRVIGKMTNSKEITAIAISRAGNPKEAAVELLKVLSVRDCALVLSVRADAAKIVEDTLGRSDNLKPPHLVQMLKNSFKGSKNKLVKMFGGFLSIKSPVDNEGFEKLIPQNLAELSLLEVSEQYYLQNKGNESKAEQQLRALLPNPNYILGHDTQAMQKQSVLFSDSK